MPTELLALVAGVGAFLVGRLVLAPAGGTTAPAETAPATATDPLLTDSATIDFPGTLQGIDQGLPPDAGGTVAPPYPLPAPAPAPATAPTSTTYPIPGVKPPSGSTGIAYANGLTKLYTVSGGVASLHTYSGLKFTAYIGKAVLYKPNATLRKILSGSHAGLYVHPGDAGLTIKNL